MTASPDNHAAWRAFLSELAACLMDGDRPRQALQPLGQAAREAKLWPGGGYDDECLLAALLRLGWMYAATGPRRRDVLGPAIRAALREAERLVGEEAPAAPAELTPAAAVTIPEPGDPRYRADLHR